MGVPLRWWFSPYYLRSVSLLWSDDDHGRRRLGRTRTMGAYMIYRVATGVLFAFLVLSLIGWAWDHRQLTKDKEDAREAASQLVRDLAQELGVQVIQVAQEKGDLLEDLGEKDGRIAQLSQSLRAAEARNTTYAHLLASATATVGDTGTIHRDTSVVERCEDCLVEGDSVTGFWSNAWLDFPWTFHALDRLNAEPSATIEADWVQTELPDGTTNLFVESTTPGATIEVPVFHWDPPAPPDPGWHWGTAAKATPIGVGIGLIGGVVFCK